MRSVDMQMSGRTARSLRILPVLERGVAALHGGEDPVRAALHGQVQMVVELRHVRVGLDQAVAEFERMRGGEADALDTGDRRDVMDQGRQIRERPSAMGPA